MSSSRTLLWHCSHCSTAAALVSALCCQPSRLCWRERTSHKQSPIYQDSDDSYYRPSAGPLVPVLVPLALPCCPGGTSLLETLVTSTASCLEQLLLEIVLPHPIETVLLQQAAVIAILLSSDIHVCSAAKMAWRQSKQLSKGLLSWWSSVRGSQIEKGRANSLFLDSFMSFVGRTERVHTVKT